MLDRILVQAGEGFVAYCMAKEHWLRTKSLTIGRDGVDACEFFE